MAKRVFKYEIPIDDEFSIIMPAFAQVLSVQVQHNRPVIWVLTDTDDNNTARRAFILAGTGQCINNLGNFIGTFQLFDGREVYHLFEKSFS